MNDHQTPVRVRYGGDYNPEQWPEEVAARDLALMTASGVNTVTLNVFGWGAIQPAPDRYDFGRLDRLFDALERQGIDVVLATPTAAPPAWMYAQDPTLLRVDERGLRVPHWSRQGYCPNHPLYERESRQIARALAERYGKRPNLVLWHINNEYLMPCYCDICADAFRAWLLDRYGSLDRLNEAWQLSQWSLQRTDWAQISPPVGGMAHTSASLDYQRFLSDSHLRGFLAEKEEIVQITPDIPVTTNFYALDFRGQIHHQWAPHLDVISWDSYPPHRDHAVWAAFRHDYFRGLKRRPFLLMEQATSGVNWKPYNPAKRPGMMRLQSYQALARGAEAILFFQFRQSRGGVEKFHSAMVSHGSETDNRVYREVRQLGGELAGLGELARSRQTAKAAVLYDQTIDWLIDWNRASRDVSYRDAATAFYRPLYEGNIPVDVVHPLSDLGGYDLVVAPMLYMFEEGVPERLREYVAQGGKLVMSYLSGMVNGCDVVAHGGFLRPIDDVFGIRVEEWDAFEPDMSNRIRWLSAEGNAGSDASPADGAFRAEKWAEVVHLCGAEALAVFEEDYHAGAPAVTRHRYGLGEAYYVATHPEDAFLRELLLGICRAHGVKSACPNAPAGVEVTVRQEGGARYWFVLNHRPEPVAWTMPEAAGGYELLERRNLTDGWIALEGYGALVIRQGGGGPA